MSGKLVVNVQLAGRERLLNRLSMYRRTEDHHCPILTAQPVLQTWILCCSETDPRIDPSRYINLSANGNSASVIKTAGGRTADAINSIYSVDQSSRIAMIIVLQHTGCAWAPGDSDSNIRSDVDALKSSPYVKNEIPIVGYVLDVETGKLKEVNLQQSSSDEAARRQVLSELQDFGPFWS